MSVPCLISKSNNSETFTDNLFNWEWKANGKGRIGRKCWKERRGKGGKIDRGTDRYILTHTYVDL